MDEQQTTIKQWLEECTKRVNNELTKTYHLPQDYCKIRLRESAHDGH
jgi:hypothetical protein